jgi:phosphotransferase system HPr-like phosphotransfer protein
MMLGAAKDTVLTVVADGEDAAAVIEALDYLFKTGFGELEMSGESSGGKL